MNTLKKAIATVKGFAADERTQVTTISTLGVGYQVWLAKKFYSQLFPAVKKEENNKLKACYILLGIFMTGVYGYNIVSVLGGCIESFKLHKEKKEAEEKLDAELERFQHNLDFMDKIHEMATTSEEECE